MIAREKFSTGNIVRFVLIDLAIFALVLGSIHSWRAVVLERRANALGREIDALDSILVKFWSHKDWISVSSDQDKILLKVHMRHANLSEERKNYLADLAYRIAQNEDQDSSTNLENVQNAVKSIEAEMAKRVAQVRKIEDCYWAFCCSWDTQEE